MLGRILLITCTLVLRPAAGALADTYPRQPGVDVQHYRFVLTLADETDAIVGEATVFVRLTGADVSRVALDLAGLTPERRGRGMVVDAVTAGADPLPFRHAGDRLEIPIVPPAAAGEVRSFTVRYHGVPADGLVISANKFGDRTFFGDNFPDRARHWLPVLDHPSDKATCEFIVTMPGRYRAIATGQRVEETDLADGRRLAHWRTSVPIPTYDMVIGVGRFAVQYGPGGAGVPVETWAFPQDRDAWFRAFAVAPRMLEYFTFQVGPYPYEKLANVQSRTRWGGMENAGNIFYAQTLDVTDGVEGIAAHEIAHQWFGNAVTVADWNHVWLSEGFATYFSHLYEAFTRGHARLAEAMAADRRLVLAYAGEHPDARIVDPREPVERILNRYTYQKGAWVLHMLRRRLGDDHFFAGVREYYRRFRDGNALTDDLRRVFEEVSGVDLRTFFDQWVYGPGHPRLGASWSYDAGARVLVVTIDQRQAGPPFVFDLDLGLTFADGTRRVETVAISSRSQPLTVPLDAPPVALTLDPDTWLLAEFEVVPRAAPSGGPVSVSGPGAPVAPPRR